MGEPPEHGGDVSPRKSGDIAIPVVREEPQLSHTPCCRNISESDHVHEQIRDIASVAKDVIKNNFQKHATSQEQVFQGLRLFGPSAQSQKLMRLEYEAAAYAMNTGVYVVWRCDKPKLSGANTNFCVRIGARHRCFCGHSLKEHEEPRQTNDRVVSPGCTLCGCLRYAYVPNEPEEVGEGWLSRRANWKPSSWSAKCRCGHGHLKHDPKSHNCNECFCASFISHFLCVVCDCSWEAHETAFQSEGKRMKLGLPVREKFFPLGDVEWSLRDAILNGPTSNAKAPPPCIPRVTMSAGRVPSGRVCLSATPPNQRSIRRPPSAAQPLPPHCSECGAIFRSPQSKFCSNCGKPRA
uniref:Uncharacterized protein TCIL3000_10_11840 n=1 Tax=Trypanosoma congolense (strain IL3000) TaxID=1068625 RepID=G0UYD6_TRYCI|nr:unnamed protein product [Trypanosoma congolense IL3000]